MVTIESFLAAGGGRLVPVGAFEGPLRDGDHVEGAIRLVVDGTEVLDPGLVDYVDQLWAYIGSPAADAVATGDAQVYFPGQPIRFRLTRTRPGRILLALDMGTPGHVRTAEADEAELLRALAVNGAAFFEAMTRLNPGHGGSYQRAVDRLNALR
ncbi:hypothetical protein [Allonocardiopsis opalescens]|uniref:Uncharacterized protein n=1 Tax=Allonocardiopsis opalescens TaxID=1144618 RepID=A0A2T0Q7W6_9ACTN|nr:hypothetical protein [Allonocardiopsis opalescens]PRX99888.1 hypothetical protein CLV72_103495 [Allonocardiopsis opalescens]